MEWSELILKWADVILKLLQIIVSWPVVILIMAIFILPDYKESIKDLFARLAEGEFAGGKLRFKPPIDKEKVESELKEIEKSTNLESNKFYEELTEQIKTGEAEKADYQKKIQDFTEKIADYKLRQAVLQAELKTAKIYQILDETPIEQIKLLKSIISRIGKERFANLSEADLINETNSILMKMAANPMLKSWLINLEVIDNNHYITRKGLEMLKIISKKT